MKIQTRILSSLEKVFLDQAPQACTVPFTCLPGESFAFQIAVLPERIAHYNSYTTKVQVTSPLPVTVKQVGYVPTLLAAYNDADNLYLTDKPGLFPDPLYSTDRYRLYIGRWNSFFVEVFPSTDIEPGTYPITLTFTSDDQRCPEPGQTFTVNTELTVSGKALPASELKYTCWFHSDCLADYYHVKPYSEEHWEIIEKQVALAAKRGQNMILTPVFTPALDTAVGHERTTVQLLGITKTGDTYSFDFSKLDRWIEMCQRCGIRYFEISHLFSQWGAKACPKVMATVDGTEQRIFGWETDSLSPEYHDFLSQLLPALIAHFDSLGLHDSLFFHISDEPHGDHLPRYLELKNKVAPLLQGLPLMDAMSDYEYYEQGVCEWPIVATSALDPFFEKGRPEDFWVYYCCGQGTNGLSNRFLAMPGFRTRIIGVQWYLFDVKGFLQWGLNFYNSCLSLRHINPFEVTDGEGAFPGGDPFVIYPGEKGEAMESQRLVIFHEAIQDLAALQLLESLTSRDFVVNLIQEGVPEPITFTSYPADPSYLLRLRQKVNEEIAARA